MKCPFCNNELDKNAKFCHYCGSSLSQENKEELNIGETKTEIKEDNKSFPVSNNESAPLATSLNSSKLSGLVIGSTIVFFVIPILDIIIILLSILYINKMSNSEDASGLILIIVLPMLIVLCIIVTIQFIANIALGIATPLCYKRNKKYNKGGIIAIIILVNIISGSLLLADCNKNKIN